VAQHPLSSPRYAYVPIKFFRLMSFRGLCVRSKGFRNDHVKHDKVGSHCHHSHAVMVMIFEAKGCATSCPKRLPDKDHTYIFGSMDKKIMMSSRCFSQPQQKALGYVWIFRSPVKYTLQRIKRQGNRRFLQADKVKSPGAAHLEILDSTQN
jgi:hypothetical protein